MRDFHAFQQLFVFRHAQISDVPLNKNYSPLLCSISIKNEQTKPIDDTFSSNLLSLTYPVEDASQQHNLYQSNATDGLVYKIQKGNRQEFKGEFGPLRCDIKCEYIPKVHLVGQQFVYGTDWKFEVSVEGSVRLGLQYNWFRMYLLSTYPYCNIALLFQPENS